jgi:hypothetical protein
MAHRIEQQDKQQGLTMAWHNLTEVVSALTLEDNWLAKWDVSPTRLQKRGKDTRYAVLEATDIPELEIGRAYNTETFTPVTNKDFLELVRQSIAGTEHKIVSVGSVRNRGRVFLSIELAGMEKFKAAGRQFSAFLNFGNGHDKSSVLWVNTSNTCTVCDNTFSTNLFSVENREQKDGDDNLKVSVRHTKNVILKLPALAQLIDRAVGVQAEFQLAMDTLDGQSLTPFDAHSLFAGFLGRKSSEKTVLSTRTLNTIGKLDELFVRGRGNNGKTRADAFSAVTDYYTHFSSGGDNQSRQFLSSEFGNGLTNKQDFLQVITDDATVGEYIHKGNMLLSNVAA